MDTNTVQVINSFGEKLDSYVSALASKAGVAADHFYPIFVRQQYIEGWCSVVVAIACILGAVFMLMMAAKNVDAANSRDGTYRDTVKTAIGFALGGILCLASIFAIVDAGSVGVSKIFNPEYHAVQSLVQMVK